MPKQQRTDEHVQHEGGNWKFTDAPGTNKILPVLFPIVKGNLKSVLNSVGASYKAT